jgi:AmiR/NasT family two-component response regulator
VIEQAKGVLAERAGIHVDEAFAIMRRHARDHNKRIGRLAGDIVEGRVSVDELRSTDR